MEKRGIIKKISRGTFAFPNYTGPIKETLRIKIEKLLNKHPTNVSDLINKTSGKPVSVIVQLNKLYKKGKIKRVKRGVYPL